MSISYADTRDSEHLRLLTPAIDAFIARPPSPRAATSTCPRQTVFFFPGGLATQLLRAPAKFKDGVTKPQTFDDYEVVWVTLEGIKIGTPRHLRMHRDGAGVFRDKGDRIIVPYGVIHTSLYEDFVGWCADNNLDLFVLDWDWRRRLEDTVTFFVRTFLPFFRARVLAHRLPDPLARFSLIGHSFGGMVVNLILRGNDPIVANLGRAITVATPFYGYAAQMHRWFEGDEVVNGEGIFKDEMMGVIASLPSLYTLHYLDEATYRDRATQAGLALDPEFPLTSYPSMDATIATVRADPYNPKTNGSLVRFPAMTGFDLAELDYGRLQAQQLVAPMAANLAEKFFNIRGVVTEDDQQTPRSTTLGDVTCDWIPTSFDSTDPSPIVDRPKIPGDDTQPAWSARLATNAPARSITVRASDMSHMFIMNNARTLEALGSILCPPGAAMSPPVPPKPEPASDEDLVAFLRWLHTQRRRRTKTILPRFDDPALRDLVPPELKEKLPGITRRIVMDIMKRPAPPGLSGPAGGGTRRPVRRKRRRPRKPARKPTARKPAARRRRRRAR